MPDAKDGMNYAPSAAKPKPVVGPGDFKIAAAYFDHGHIHGLTEAGAELALIYDPDEARLKTLREKYPNAKVARSFDEVLEPDVRLVTAADANQASVKSILERNGGRTVDL